LSSPDCYVVIADLGSADFGFAAPVVAAVFASARCAMAPDAATGARDPAQAALEAWPV
jgi:hypothetical protein